MLAICWHAFFVRVQSVTSGTTGSYLQYILFWDMNNFFPVSDQVHMDGQTESDAYESIMQYAQVGSKSENLDIDEVWNELFFIPYVMLGGPYFAFALDRFLGWCSLQITEKSEFYLHATLGGQERQNILDYGFKSKAISNWKCNYFFPGNTLALQHSYTLSDENQKSACLQLRGPPGLDTAFLWRDQNP